MANAITRRQLCAAVPAALLAGAVPVAAASPSPAPASALPSAPRKVPARPPMPAYPHVTASPELRAAYAAGLEALCALPDPVEPWHLDRVQEVWFDDLSGPILDFSMQARLHLGISGNATTADLWRLVRLLGLEGNIRSSKSPVAQVLAAADGPPIILLPADDTPEAQRESLIWALSVALWGAYALGLGDFKPSLEADVRTHRVYFELRHFIGRLANLAFETAFVRDPRTLKKAMA